MEKNKIFVLTEAGYFTRNNNGSQKEQTKTGGEGHLSAGGPECCGRGWNTKSFCRALVVIKQRRLTLKQQSPPSE
jgi:hypothetical protein